MNCHLNFVRTCLFAALSGVLLYTQTAAAADVCANAAEHGSITLSCPSGQKIQTVVFASYGNAPSGSCGAYKASTSCNASNSVAAVKSACLGKASCSVGAGNDVFGDPCSGVQKKLYADVQCSGAAATPTPTPVAGNPDMIVTSIAMNPAAPKVGDKVTFSAVVKNQGGKATPAGIVTGVAFTVDGNASTVTWAGGYNISIPAGSSVTLTANGSASGVTTYTASGGSHSVEAFVDDVNRYAESNENNNKLSKSFSVGAVATPTPTATPPSQSFNKPALVNPVDPKSYGAKCDGVTDDTAAFKAALNASDVKVSGGTCVLNNTITISVSNRHLECAQGTVLKRTTGYNGNMLSYVAPNGQSLSGDSIVNCTFLGANTEAARYYNDDERHYDIPVQTNDRVNNFFLAGNTFKQFFGQSMFQTEGTIDGGSGSQIIYNTFKSCGYYGPVFVAHKNGVIGHNTLVDCAAGVENNNAQNNTGGNIIEYNTSTCVHGYGAPDMAACTMITGGITANADYSANIVRYNTVSGIADSAGAHPGYRSEIEVQKNGAEKAPAQYIGNVCNKADGCDLQP
jgi:hypothetical protein